MKYIGWACSVRNPSDKIGLARISEWDRQLCGFCRLCNPLSVFRKHRKTEKGVVSLRIGTSLTLRWIVFVAVILNLNPTE